MRARYVVLSLGLVMALGSAGISGAGNNGPNPNWFNAPLQGPSPNATHEVGNTDGGECGREVGQDGFAGSISLGGGGGFVPGNVEVVLLPPGAQICCLAQESYPADQNGNWGGPFPIPSGLDPGTYPLQAFCTEVFNGFVQGQGSVVLGGFAIFEYTHRSYIVIGESKPAKDVEAEVRLTG